MNVGSIRLIIAGMLASFTAFPAVRTVRDEPVQVPITGGSSAEGRCTLRVRVDHEAELNLRGDLLRLRTFHGESVADSGSQCSMPLRRGITAFKLTKTSGRGDVRLAEEPSARNGWRAVIGVHDAKSGLSEYAIELNWRESIAQERRITDAWGSELLAGPIYTPSPWTGGYRWTPVESTGRGGLSIDGKDRDGIVRVAAAERGREILDVLLRGESGRQYWVRTKLVEWGGNRIEAALLEFDGAPAAGRMTVQTAQDGQWVERIDLDGRVHGDKLKLQFRR